MNPTHILYAMFILIVLDLYMVILTYSKTRREAREIRKDVLANENEIKKIKKEMRTLNRIVRDEARRRNKDISK